MALRKIEPYLLPSGARRATVNGARPQLKWVAPTSLLVDDSYQRSLGKASARLIPKVVAEFAWSRMKPPVVVKVDGGLHVINGQHTAIAAATLAIAEIPVFVVDADTLDERALSFVSHNTDSVKVSAIAIYRALVAAGDKGAVAVRSVCQSAGITIKTINQSSSVNIGDTMAIGLIRRLVRQRGPADAVRVLSALVSAKRAPISAEEIKAADYLICEDAHGASVVVGAIRIEGDAGLAKARARASVNRTPIWREVKDRWHRALVGESGGRR